MCGIFGSFSKSSIDYEVLKKVGMNSLERGQDSSGLIYQNNELNVRKASFSLKKLFAREEINDSHLIAGHSRLATNSISDNQPVVKNGVLLIHNGIVCNYQELYSRFGLTQHYEIDSEIIIDLYNMYLREGNSISEACTNTLLVCEGVVSAVIFDTNNDKIIFLSNNGSFYYSQCAESVTFASEQFPLLKHIGGECKQLIGIKEFDFNLKKINVLEELTESTDRNHYLPDFQFNKAEFDLLEYEPHKLKRCTKCILPETMPYIHFDSEGVCNYCHNYTISNSPKPLDDLRKLIEPYRKRGKRDCIVPFSGGRDSSYGLHIICKELDLNPIAYTYDWGMVTDLGRRNISRMCAALGVENIIIAADIGIKRRNIKKNLEAWLKRPHLGMISLLTAGDKHFFRHVETVKRQTNISLNLWGVNPMEVTHFKTGFLNIPPAFEAGAVYNSGVMKQARYQSNRFAQFIKNPRYFNSSLKDTLTGEYWRSIHKKTDYYHIFDFYRWEEEVVDNTLMQYNWEFSPDLKSSWRIGDATAAFYNYIYYTVAGFTEHDTFRSNEVREGLRTRDEALEMVAVENAPRYESIRWYLDALEIDFIDAIRVVNNIPKIGNLQ